MEHIQSHTIVFRFLLQVRETMYYHFLNQTIYARLSRLPSQTSSWLFPVIFELQTLSCPNEN